MDLIHFENLTKIIFRFSGRYGGRPLGATSKPYMFSMDMRDLQHGLNSDSSLGGVDVVELESTEPHYDNRLKVCTRCGSSKSLCDFHKNKSRPDGLQAHCKTCTSRSKREKYKAKKRRLRQANGLSVEVCGNPSDEVIDAFSIIYVEAIKGLIENGKL